MQQKANISPCILSNPDCIVNTFLADRENISMLLPPWSLFMLVVNEMMQHICVINFSFYRGGGVTTALNNASHGPVAPPLFVKNGVTSNRWCWPNSQLTILHKKPLPVYAVPVQWSKNTQFVSRWSVCVHDLKITFQWGTHWCSKSGFSKVIFLS